ncbi:hypothetical protein BFC21_08865 [Pseudomonas sp. TMW 2.1634]|nr:hypothetical protein BFC21_08865 [Pseudomonas sp. TMW 2.1634]
MILAGEYLPATVWMQAGNFIYSVQRQMSLKHGTAGVIGARLYTMNCSDLWRLMNKPLEGMSIASSA